MSDTPERAPSGQLPVPTQEQLPIPHGPVLPSIFLSLPQVRSRVGEVAYEYPSNASILELGERTAEKLLTPDEQKTCKELFFKVAWLIGAAEVKFQKAMAAELNGDVRGRDVQLEWAQEDLEVASMLGNQIEGLYFPK